MGLSSSLLLLAVVTAVVPVALIGLHPPRRVRDLEKLVVAGFIIVVAGTVVINGLHDLHFFGLAHLLYLLGVVTVPLFLGIWFVLSRVRRDHRRIDVLLGAIGGLIALCGLYATHVEPNWLRLDRVQVQAAVPSTLRIGVIADLQTPTVGDYEHKVIATVLEQKPDLVVVPGDWFQGTAETITANREDFIDLLRQLVAATPLVVVTTGDSDHSIPLQPMVEESGAVFIDDTIGSYAINGVDVRVAGVRVLANGPARDNTLARLAEPSDAFTLLVAHRPDAIYDLASDADVDLVISGHTHGGQVAIPFFGPPVTFSDVPRDLAGGGLGVINNVPIYVSAGAGMERLQAPQVRFGVRPEVAIIEVVPR